MSPDVTIKISLDSDGTATSHEVAASALPGPMALDSLGVAASSGAPSPMTAAEMSNAQGQATSGEEPIPMAIEQLSGAVSVGAPEPEPLGALQAAGGPPAPQSPEQLPGVSMGEAPKPLDPDELEAAKTPETGLRGQRRSNPRKR